MIPILRHSGVFCLISFFAATGAGAQPVAIDIGTTLPAGSNRIVAFAVNDIGHVVGRFYLSTFGPPHAFVWTPAGGALELAPGRRSWAYDVNNAGQVVGHIGAVEAERDPPCTSSSCVPPPNDPQAFIWSARDGMVELGTLGGARSEALKVNEAGQVFGWSEIASSETVHAFVWTPNGGMVDLGPWPRNDPDVVNDRGDAIFNIPRPPDVLGSVWTAFLWTPTGGLLKLPTRGGRAAGLNDKGDVVGYRRSSRGVEHPFLWTPSDGMMDLGTLGGLRGGATGVNEDRWVVGQIDMDPASTQTAHAFLWTPTGEMGDLGSFGGTESLASAVNERGQVVGFSRLSSGEGRGFVWTATTGMVELPPVVGYAESEGQLVSNGGHVVGRSFTQGGSDVRPTLWLVPPPDTVDDWTFCAPEGGFCAFTGTTDVRYGADGAFSSRR